jgi:DNA recombination protein RmuC
MLDVVLVVAGLVTGAGVAWWGTRAHFLPIARAEREVLGARLAAAEMAQDDARKQLTERELRVAELQAALDGERTQRVQAETRWAAARENLDEQRRLIDEARERLTETFKAASGDVLRASADTFLDRARETLEAQMSRRHEAIEGLLRPLAEQVRRAEEHVRELERKREQAYGSIETQIGTLARQGRELEREAGNLAAALRGSQTRGRWGEVALRRVIELAGMTAHVDFSEQVSVDGDNGRLRPDVVVRLPGHREIVIDAKVPLTAFLDAVHATTTESRHEALARHARDVRSHLTQLAARDYARQFARSPQFVVMFVPGDAFVAAAESDPEIVVDGIRRGVALATPTTLFALLAAVERGWQQQQAAQHAETITKLGQDLYDRLRTLAEHFEAIGGALKRGTEAYNRAVGSMERMVLPAARRFRDVGAGSAKDIPVLEPVDEQPRILTAPEFPAAGD